MILIDEINVEGEVSRFSSNLVRRGCGLKCIPCGGDSVFQRAGERTWCGGKGRRMWMEHRKQGRVVRWW